MLQFNPLTAFGAITRASFMTLLLTLSASPLTAKENVSLDDQLWLAEVTGNDIRIRSGAGTQFPIAYYITDWGNEKMKQEVMPAYKGQHLWVKDAGDWWEIDYRASDLENASRQFISKNYCKLIETERFDMDSITSPQVWMHAEEEEDEFGDSYTAYNIATIYPNGLVVTQYYSTYDNSIKIGTLNKDMTAVFYQINTSVSDYGDPDSADHPLSITVHTDNLNPHLSMEIGENRKSTFTHAGMPLEYVDISEIPAEKWISIVKELKQSNDFRLIRLYRTDPDAYLVYDTLLSTYTRIK